LDTVHLYSILLTAIHNNNMVYTLLFVMIGLVPAFGRTAAVPKDMQTNEQLPPRAGFSAACRGHRSIGKMARTAEVVVEAEVVEVTPPRDNIYAVTLQVS
jgi:hypothetical protein